MHTCLHIQSIKKDGGVPAIASCLPRIKAEAERLEVMDTAAGIMADHLYTDQLLTQIKQYRPIMLHVRREIETLSMHD